MKKQRLNPILFWVVVIVVGTFLGSCSTKKKKQHSDLQEVKTEVAQQAEITAVSQANVKLNTRVIVDDKSQRVSIIKSWSPVDPSLPSSKTDPDGIKTDFHNAVLKEETITESKDLKTESSDQSEALEKKSTIAKEEIKGKAAAKKVIVNDELDRSGFNFWSWFWIAAIVVIGLVMVYLNHRFKLIKRVTSIFYK